MKFGLPTDRVLGLCGAALAPWITLKPRSDHLKFAISCSEKQDHLSFEREPTKDSIAIEGCIGRH